MKITKELLVLVLGISIMSCQNKKASLEIKNRVDSVSYVMGVLDGGGLIQSFEQGQIDSLIDMEIYLDALLEGANKEELRMNPDSNEMVLRNFFQEFQMHKMMEMSDTTGNAQKFAPAQSLLDSVSYLMGAGAGKGLIESFEKAGLDTLVRVDIYLDALVTSAKKGEVKLEGEANLPMVNEFFTNLKEKEMNAKFGANKTAGEEFLAKNKAVEGVVVTNSGLQYEVIKEGKGAQPTLNDQVKVHYTGSLLDGTIFDSSVGKDPAVFGVGQVIKGWTEALQLMTVGSKWKLYIPYDIAYGTRDMGEIKPYSMLIFEVELLEIVKQ